MERWTRQAKGKISLKKYRDYVLDTEQIWG